MQHMALKTIPDKARLTVRELTQLLFVYLFSLLGVENSWLEADRPVSLTVRLVVPVRETHLDHEGKGAHSEAPVCGLRK